MKLPSVTGRIIVPEAWRVASKRNVLNKQWLAKIRDTLVDKLAERLEALDDAQHTPIMAALKAQFCVSEHLVVRKKFRLFAEGDRCADAKASALAAAARVALLVVGVAR